MIVAPSSRVHRTSASSCARGQGRAGGDVLLVEVDAAQIQQPAVEQQLAVGVTVIAAHAAVGEVALEPRGRGRRTGSAWPGTGTGLPGAHSCGRASTTVARAPSRSRRRGSCARRSSVGAAVGPAAGATVCGLEVGLVTVTCSSIVAAQVGHGRIGRTWTTAHVGALDGAQVDLAGWMPPKFHQPPPRARRQVAPACGGRRHAHDQPVDPVRRTPLSANSNGR